MSVHEEGGALRVGVAPRQKTWIVSGTLVPVNLSDLPQKLGKGRTATVDNAECVKL